MFRVQKSKEGENVKIKSCYTFNMINLVRDNFAQLTIHYDHLNECSSTLQAYANQDILSISLHTNSKTSWKRVSACNLIVVGSMLTGKLEISLSQVRTSKQCDQGYDNQTEKISTLMDHIKQIASSLENIDQNIQRELAISFIKNLAKIDADTATLNADETLAKITQFFQDEASMHEKLKTTRLARGPGSN